MTVRTPPRIDDVIRLSDGRTLAFAEWGDPDGFPVLFFHGVPGSRVWVDDPANASRRVRLITVDRPGYGRSSTKPLASLQGWTQDVAELADALGLETFGIMSWSMGGPFALACAAVFPERVPRVALISISHLPPEQAPEAYDALSPREREEAELAASDPERLIETWVREGKYEFYREPENILTVLSETDPWLADSPVLRSMLAEHIREAFRSGLAGMLWEEVIVLRPWGFGLRDVPSEVFLWRGERESSGRSEFVAEQIPRSQLTIWPAEGHCGFLRHWDEVLGVLIS